MEEVVDLESAQNRMISDFANAYSSLTGLHVVDIRRRDSPDFELTIAETGDRFAVETTGLYQDTREAMINYNKLRQWGTFTGDFGRLASTLQERLNAKAKASLNYEYHGRIFLAIWVGSLPFSHADDAGLLAREVHMPPSRFDHVFLVHRGIPPEESALTEIAADVVG
jgi:hypothetical protein